MVSHRIDRLLAGNMDSDPIRVFIKPEPHKVSKIEEGRLRIISSVSAVDTMIDRMLYTDLSEAIVLHHYRTNFMIGWTPIKLGIVTLRTKLALTTRYLNVDKSAFDWTVPWWLIEELRKYVLALAVGNGNEWNQVHNARFHCLFDKPVFEFSDGTVVQQQLPGVMKSGCYLTIILNSIGQVLIHSLIEYALEKEFELPICVGDDTVQAATDDQRYLIAMEQLGFALKPQVSDKIMFAGVIAEGPYAYLPEYVEKNMFNLAHVKDEDLGPMLASLQYLYYHDKEVLAELRRITVENGLYAYLVSEEQLCKVLYN